MENVLGARAQMPDAVVLHGAMWSVPPDGHSREASGQKSGSVGRCTPIRGRRPAEGWVGRSVTRCAS